MLLLLLAPALWVTLGAPYMDLEMKTFVRYNRVPPGVQQHYLGLSVFTYILLSIGQFGLFYKFSRHPTVGQVIFGHVQV